MSKKLLLALLTVAPIFAQAQALVETTGKALLEQGTNAATSSIVEGTTRSALEATAAAQMHARPQISVTVTPAQTAVQIPPTQVPVASTPATRITGPSSILQIPTLPQGGENTSSLRNTLTTALSRVIKPSADSKKEEQFKYYTEEFPYTLDAASPDKMDPQKLAEAKQFYQEYLARPYDFADHEDYLTAITMLAYLGEAGDGSGKAIYNFLTSYDLNQNAFETTLQMSNDADQAHASLMRSFKQDELMVPPTRSLQREEASKALDQALQHNGQIFEKRIPLLDKMIASQVGLYPYMTELIGIRALLMLKEYDLINHSMKRLNHLLTSIEKFHSEPLRGSFLSNLMWRKIMPYMELEYISNNLNRYLPQQTEKWPLIFPEWDMQPFGLFPPVFHTESEKRVFWDNFVFEEADVFPLGEKVIFSGHNLLEWIRAVKVKNEGYKAKSFLEEVKETRDWHPFFPDFYKGDYKEIK